ncbi:MAG: response regulator transcription factor [Cyanobacteria bacterium J06626_14]
MARLENPIRVLLVDDEDIIRYGLSAMLRCEAMVEVIGEARNGAEAIAQVQALQPDVVLMDINMPVMDGITATQEIHQMQPQVSVLIVTTCDQQEHLITAICEGAVGYLLKNTSPEDLARSIQAAHKGYMQLSPGLGQKLCQHLRFSNPQKTRRKLKDVTLREQEVLNLIAEGASNREISQRLYISEKTVKNHVSNILRRLALRDRTQLAIWANTLNLETPHALSA